MVGFFVDSYPAPRPSFDRAAHDLFQRNRSSHSRGVTMRISSRFAGDDLLTVISQLITAGLSGSFESLRDKVSETITENGEAYLKEGVEKITHTTASLVKWSKKNPLKMAAGIAALMAVSAFLFHIMHGKTGAPEVAKKMMRKAAAARG